MLIAQRAAERAARDKAIAEKERAAGLASVGGDNSVAAHEEAEGWGRSQRRPAPSSPEKPRGGNEDGDGFAIRRSAKPRNTEEEKSNTGFGRGPARNDAPDTGFVRGNFRTRKDEEKEAPKRPARNFGGAGGASGDSGSGATGFGFRNTNAKRGRK